MTRKTSAAHDIRLKRIYGQVRQGQARPGQAEKLAGIDDIISGVYQTEHLQSGQARPSEEVYAQPKINVRRVLYGHGTNLILLQDAHTYT